MARENALWFAFDGTRSDDMGLRVARLPDIPAAEARGESVEIPGRDGALWLPDHTFRPVTMRVTFEAGGATDIEAATAWLTGEGRLVLSTFPEHYWRARVVRGFQWEPGIHPGGGWQGSVEFSCQPFRYRLGDPSMDPITEPGTFMGDGTWPARPVVTVYGSGSITLMLNDASVLLEDVDDHVTLDCDAMMAFRDDENVSPTVTLLSDGDEWPTLEPGLNLINWTGSVLRVEIRPNWRWR